MTANVEMSFDIGTSIITIDGKQIHTVANDDGALLWSANEIGEALGYSHGRIATMITREWSEEFLEGEEFVRVRTAGSRGRRSIYLTEFGVNLVCQKCNRGYGKKFRRFFAREVIPALRKTGFYRTLNHSRYGIASDLKNNISEVADRNNEILKGEIVEVIDSHVRNFNRFHTHTVQQYMELIWGVNESRNYRSWGKKIKNWAKKNNVLTQVLVEARTKKRLEAYPNVELDRFFREEAPQYRGE